MSQPDRSQHDRAAQFRQLHAQRPLILPNAWDAASARVIEQVGASPIRFHVKVEAPIRFHVKVEAAAKRRLAGRAHCLPLVATYASLGQCETL